MITNQKNDGSSNNTGILTTQATEINQKLKIKKTPVTKGQKGEGEK